MLVRLTRRVAGPVVGFAGDAAGRALLAGVDAVLSWDYTEQAIRRVLSGPELERLLLGALSSDEAKQTLSRVLDSGLIEELVEDLLASDEFWRLIEGVSRSPEVTAALTRTSRGLADEVADQVRVRSSGADAWLERRARRIGSRRRVDDTPLLEP